MRCSRLGVVLAAWFSCGGCTYLKNRANDLLDSFRFDVAFTPGLHVDARVTDFAAVGAGVRGGVVVGMHGRFAIRHRTVNIGLGPLMFGEIFSVESSALLGGREEYDWDHDVVPGQFFFMPLMGVERPRPWSLERRGLHVADIGVNVAAVVGAGVGFSPGEFVDLLLGFVGIDIAGDDVAGKPRETEVPQPPEAEKPPTDASR